MIKLVADWKSAHKWLSVQGSAIGLAAVATWGLLPDEMRASFTPGQLQASAGVLFLLILGGRLIDQK